MKNKLLCIIILFSTISNIFSQNDISILNLRLVSINTDTNVNPDPFIFLSSDSSVSFLCPCFFYHQAKGTWGKIADSTYSINIIENAIIYYADVIDIDSTPIDKGISLIFKETSGKPLSQIELNFIGTPNRYTADSNGKIHLYKPNKNIRTRITVKQFNKRSFEVSLSTFKHKTKYIITLTPPKTFFSYNYYLKKEGLLWSLYDRSSNKILGKYESHIFPKKNN